MDRQLVERMDARKNNVTLAHPNTGQGSHVASSVKFCPVV